MPPRIRSCRRVADPTADKRRRWSAGAVPGPDQLPLARGSRTGLIERSTLTARSGPPPASTPTRSAVGIGSRRLPNGTGGAASTACVTQDHGQIPPRIRCVSRRGSCPTPGDDAEGLRPWERAAAPTEAPPSSDNTQPYSRDRAAVENHFSPVSALAPGDEEGLICDVLHLTVYSSRYESRITTHECCNVANTALSGVLQARTPQRSNGLQRREEAACSVRCS